MKAANPKKKKKKERSIKTISRIKREKKGERNRWLSSRDQFRISRSMKPISLTVSSFSSLFLFLFPRPDKRSSFDHSLHSSERSLSEIFRGIISFLDPPQICQKRKYISLLWKEKKFSKPNQTFVTFHWNKKRLSFLNRTFYNIKIQNFYFYPKKKIIYLNNNNI